jgi:ribosomal protein L37E
MATRSTDTRRERCEQCGRETAHAVSIELRTESTDGQNAAFSREPYRVTECRRCGTTASRRMNDA